jgi:hypothetical protein
LRDRRDEEIVGFFLDGGERQCLGVRHEDEDGRIGGIDLLVVRRLRHRLRQCLPDAAIAA